MNSDVEKGSKVHQTIHPQPFQMICIVLVQLMNAADWAVILPIDTDIASFLGFSSTYGALLLAALYVPFPLSLVVFRSLESYKYGYAFWASSCVLGNLMYVGFMIWRPTGVWFWLVLSRVLQGMAQCVTFQNKQILAYTTSWDVRNEYQASLSSGNIFGNAFGVMLCASYDKFIGTNVYWIHSTPDYLILGSLSIVMLAGVSGMVMLLCHPHDVKMVPEEYRIKPGAASVMPVSALGKLSENESRKIRIIATLLLGFLRVTCRCSWQQVVISLLRHVYGLSTWNACIVFSVVTLSGLFAQQTFPRIHHMVEDEQWVRITEAFSLLAAVLMCNVGNHQGEYSRDVFVAASIIFYSSLSINANVTSVNATKYSIENSEYFNQKSITTWQVITQNMLGKICGPLLGQLVYENFGQNGFALCMVVLNVVATLCAEITMPPTMKDQKMSKNYTPQGQKSDLVETSAENTPLLQTNNSVP